MEILHSISGKIKSILLVVKSNPALGKTEWMDYDVRDGIQSLPMKSEDVENHENPLDPML